MAALATARDKKVAVLKTPGTKNLLIRIRKPDGKYYRKTSGTPDVKEALNIGRTLYDKMLVRIEEKMSPFKGENKFLVICEEYKQIILDKIENGVSIPNEINQIGIIDNYIIPFMGNKGVDAIDDQTIYEYERFHEKKIGKRPSKGTINKHFGVMRQLFEMIARKKLRNRGDLPLLTIKGKGVASKVRPHFEDHQLKILVNFLATWHLTAPDFGSRYKRQILSCYVGFLLFTGCRPNQEVKNIRNCDVEENYEDANGNQAVRIWMRHRKNDKDGQPKKIIADRFLLIYLRQLRELTGRTADDDLLFCNSDGSPIKDLSEPFGHALVECNLRYAKNGRRLVPYSLRHSHATRQILAGVRWDLLAANMDTSTTMLERTYGHLKVEMGVAELTGRPIKQKNSRPKLIDVIPKYSVDENGDEITEYNHRDTALQLADIGDQLHNTTNIERLVDYKERKKKK